MLHLRHRVTALEHTQVLLLILTSTHGVHRLLLLLRLLHVRLCLRLLLRLLLRRLLLRARGKKRRLRMMIHRSGPGGEVSRVIRESLRRRLRHLLVKCAGFGGRGFRWGRAQVRGRTPAQRLGERAAQRRRADRPDEHHLRP